MCHFPPLPDLKVMHDYVLYVGGFKIKLGAPSGLPIPLNAAKLANIIKVCKVLWQNVAYVADFYLFFGLFLIISVYFLVGE